MKKEILEKRLDALKKLGKVLNYEYKIAESGNHYITKNSKITNQFNPWNVTKATLSKIGNEFSYPNSSEVIMLTKHGKWLEKGIRDHGFRAMKRQGYSNLWYIGRKCEWVVNEMPELVPIRLATQFSSLNEYKNFLGFEFISNSEFKDLLKRSVTLPILFQQRSKEERVNLVSLSKKITVIGDIEDTINMANLLERKITIPAGLNSFDELHKELSLEVYKKQNPLREYKIELTNFNIPYEYKIVTSNHQLKERGRINKHCIGSYGESMKTDLFLVIDNLYDCNIGKPWGSDQYIVKQIRGFANCEAPVEMTNSINQALEEVLIEIKPLFEELSLSKTLPEELAF